MIICQQFKDNLGKGKAIFDEKEFADFVSLNVGKNKTQLDYINMWGKKNTKRSSEPIIYLDIPDECYGDMEIALNNCIPFNVKILYAAIDAINNEIFIRFYIMAGDLNASEIMNI